MKIYNHTNLKILENKEIAPNLVLGMLKYGYCSYFVLAMVEKYKIKDLWGIFEYDEDMGKHYLVHYIFRYNGMYYDALGSYNNWRESVKDMTDVEYMILTNKKVSKKSIKEQIIADMGFNEELYNTIKIFINKYY